MAGNKKSVQYYEHLGASLDVIAMGYAAGGYFDQAYEYLQKIPSPSDELVDDLASTCARAGAEPWVARYENSHQANLGPIAKGYATGGYYEQAATCVRACIDDDS